MFLPYNFVGNSPGMDLHDPHGRQPATSSIVEMIITWWGFEVITDFWLTCVLRKRLTVTEEGLNCDLGFKQIASAAEIEINPFTRLSVYHGV